MTSVTESASTSAGYRFGGGAAEISVIAALGHVSGFAKTSAFVGGPFFPSGDFGNCCTGADELDASHLFHLHGGAEFSVSGTAGFLAATGDTPTSVRVKRWRSRSTAPLSLRSDHVRRQLRHRKRRELRIRP